MEGQLKNGTILTSESGNKYDFESGDVKMV